jgi:hypothetical protein
MSDIIKVERKIVRAPAILTDAYVAGTVIKDLENYNQLNLYIAYVKGSLTSLQVKVEYSDDGENFYQDTFITESGDTATCVAGEYTFAPAANQNFIIALPIQCSAIRVSAKGTGTVTSSSCGIIATIGVK